MDEFDNNRNGRRRHHHSSRDGAPAAALLSRLAETEALLLEERASNQSLYDELLRVRSAAAEQAGTGTAEVVGQDGGGGSSDGKVDGRRKRSMMHRGTGASEMMLVEDRVGGEVTDPMGRGRRPEEERPPWKNGLYKRQPYADNYVPDSFLEKLVTNGESALEPAACRYCCADLF